MCNSLFDTGLDSLQLNDTFNNFISRYKRSLHRTYGFWFYKNNNDFYAVCLKELDACVYLPFLTINVLMLNYMKYLI